MSNNSVGVLLIKKRDSPDGFERGIEQEAARFELLSFWRAKGVGKVDFFPFRILSRLLPSFFMAHCC